MRSRSTAIVAALALTLAACSGSDQGSSPADTAAVTTAVPPTAAPETAPSVTSAPTTEPRRVEIPPEAEIGTILPGTEQVTLLDAPPGTSVHVVSASDEALDDYFNPGSGTTEPPPGGEVDEYGSLVVRGLTGGDTYRLVYDYDNNDGGSAISQPFTTLDRDVQPDPAFYTEQRLPTDGLGYITTRDGTTLSASVWLPGPAEDGPYPTVVEYSGYTPSDPNSSGFSDVFTALGYAYVGVNIRGTGCSGGSFRYFEYVQSLDGYDAVEAVAAQPWVQNHRVGMVGISYPGISQLFVGQTQPPSLAAITPLSVLADSAISTLYPGGILNTGFAVPWTAERMEQADRTARPGRSTRSTPATRSVRPIKRCVCRIRISSSRSPTTRSGPTRSRARSHPACSSTRSTCRPSWQARGRTSRPADTSPRCSTGSPVPITSTPRCSMGCTRNRSARRCSRGSSSSSTCM